MFLKSRRTPADSAAGAAGLPEQNHSIGAGMIVYGTVSFQGRLVVLGTVNGQIMGEAGSEMLIAPGGTVEGPVAAGTVRIRGTVEGSVHARNVHVEDGGKVEGDIEADILETAPGAKVSGRVCMRGDAGVAQVSPAQLLAAPVPAGEA